MPRRNPGRRVETRKVALHTEPVLADHQLAVQRLDGQAGAGLVVDDVVNGGGSGL